MKYILLLLFSLIVNPVFAQFIQPSASSFPPTSCVTANAVIFNNATPCDSGFTYAGGGGQVSLNGKALGSTTGLLINPASASGGLLQDWQVAGVSKASVSDTGIILGTFNGSLTIGTTSITGGATTQVLFNNAGVVGSDAGFTKVSGTTGAVTVGGVLTVPNGSFGVPSLAFANAQGFRALSTTGFTFATGGNEVIASGNNRIGEIILVSNACHGWSNSTTNATSTVDTALCRQGAGVVEVSTNSGTPNASGSLLLTNITASGANVLLTGIAATTETDMLCFNTGTGLVTHSTIAQQCTVSDITKKQDIISIDPQYALNIVANIDPIWFRFRPEIDMGNDIHAGFTMQRVFSIEPRLATNTGVKYGEMGPIWAAAIQQLKFDNDNLRIEIEALKKAIR